MARRNQRPTGPWLQSKHSNATTLCRAKKRNFVIDNQADYLANSDRSEGHNLEVRSMRALKKTFLLFAVIAALSASAVYADTITVNFLNETPLGGGLFQYNYQISEDAQGEITTGTVPGASTSLVGPNTAADYFTLYDVAGLTAMSQPVGWASESLLSGATDSAENPVDSASVPNVTFYYTGSAAILGPVTISGFAIISTVGTPGTGFWTSEDTNNPSLVNNASIGTLGIPVPEPSAVLLLGSGLVTLAGVRLRRR
jgi:hypothetical protein